MTVIGVIYIRMWINAWYFRARNETSAWISSVPHIDQVRGHQFVNADNLPRPCHYHLKFYGFVITMNACALPLGANVLTYVVGSKSFRPDQLFKVTEIKQICYFST